MIDLEALYTYAYSLYQAGKTDDAAKAFQALCTRNPLEARFWFGWAAALQDGANYKKALPVWAMSAILEPSNPYPHFHAAECATSLENREEALLALAQAKTLLSSDTHPLSSPIQALEERWRPS